MTTENMVRFTDNELKSLAINGMGRANEVHPLSIKKKLVFGSLLFLVSFGYAQNTKKCSGIERDRERSACIYAQYKEADIALNKAYNTLRNFFNPENKALLKEAQLAWLSFRDLDCQLESAPFSGGTLFDEITDKCLIEKTILRTKELIRLRDVWNM